MSVFRCGAAGCYLAGVALLSAAALSTGCVYDRCQCPDGGTCGNNDAGDGDVDIPTGSPDGTIQSPVDYINIAPGGSVDFAGAVDCPEGFGPCMQEWDFGNGQTSDQLMANTTYPAAGHYTVTFTATNANDQADPIPATVHVEVWDGAFTDDFNRTELYALADGSPAGWRTPIHPNVQDAVGIQNNHFYVEHTTIAPGSTAVTTWASAENVHVEVTLTRWHEENVRFTDIIMRMDPVLRERSFIRVRTMESGSTGLEITAFRIHQAEGYCPTEHGYRIIDVAAAPPLSSAEVDAYDSFQIILELMSVSPNVNELRVRVLGDGTDEIMHRRHIDDGTTYQDGAYDQVVDSMGEDVCPSMETLGYQVPVLQAPGATGLAIFSIFGEFDDYVMREITAFEIPEPTAQSCTLAACDYNGGAGRCHQSAGGGVCAPWPLPPIACTANQPGCTTEYGSSVDTFCDDLFGSGQTYCLPTGCTPAPNTCPANHDCVPVGPAAAECQPR